MTWWAVSLTLLNNNLGNEVLSREELLKIVPIFVAILVWLTRILFIGAVTVAGERLMDMRTDGTGRQTAVARQQTRSQSKPAPKSNSRPAPRKVTANRSRPEPVDLSAPPIGSRSAPRTNGRVRQRPPRPGGIRASNRR
jgi:hypothetical protein